MKTTPKFIRLDAALKVVGSGHGDALDAYRPLLGTWLIKLAFLMKWHDKIHLMTDQNFLEATGMDKWQKADLKEDELDIFEREDHFSQSKNGNVPTKVEFKRELNKKLVEFSKHPVRDDLMLLRNIELLGDMLGLSACDKAIVCFATILEAFQVFKGAICNTRRRVIDSRNYHQLLAGILGYTEQEIREALMQDSLLVTSGIIKVTSGFCDIEDKLDLVDGLDKVLLLENENAESLIGRLLKRASPNDLTLENFPHLDRDFQTLLPFLANAMNQGIVGTNVLFYGPPGTGKTEFAKVVSAKLGVSLFEIGYADEDGDPMRGGGRLRSLALCQRLLTGGNKALLMFDETEDVFDTFEEPDFFRGARKKMDGSKAWINRTLERNMTPTLWITNNAAIDPAYLRRFDYSIQFSVPPLKVRVQIARYHLGDLVANEDWLQGIASNEHLLPAQYERAAKVARLTSEGDPTKAQIIARQVLTQSALLLEQKPNARIVLRTRYDRQYLNIDLDVERVIAGLKQRPTASFCFYGPAGTGKSELARHIADEIDRPLVVRKASDLLSMWLGKTEKNIATMFAEAERQGAVLVLDEADSFLTDRRDAHRSWEVTQVNELLTQMEAFEGIFICTTNLMEKLDQASLRRFSFKVKFGYLTPGQRWSMFQSEFARMHGESGFSPALESNVRTLDRLTPGDFAAVARQHHLLGINMTAKELFARLQEECKIKGGASGTMGFVS